MSCSRVNQYHTNQLECSQYEKLPLHDTFVSSSAASCRASSAVPAIFHSVSRDTEPPLTVRATALVNPEYRFNHNSDEEAYQFVRRECGSAYARAYRCLVAPAYRADLFRFCALYSKGGLYLDADIVPVVPLRHLYAPCANLTVGHDWPQIKGQPSFQMKIIAGVPRHPVFQCMMRSILRHVRLRHVPSNPLNMSGPVLLSHCIRKTGTTPVVSYLDTRNAAHPYSGMRTRLRLLAYERPNEMRMWLGKDASFYGDLHSKRRVYDPKCNVSYTPCRGSECMPPPPPRSSFLVPYQRLSSRSLTFSRTPTAIGRATVYQRRSSRSLTFRRTPTAIGRARVHITT